MVLTAITLQLVAKQLSTNMYIFKLFASILTRLCLNRDAFKEGLVLVQVVCAAVLQSANSQQSHICSAFLNIYNFSCCPERIVLKSLCSE